MPILGHVAIHRKKCCPSLKRRDEKIGGTQVLRGGRAPSSWKLLLLHCLPAGEKKPLLCVHLWCWVFCYRRFHLLADTLAFAELCCPSHSYSILKLIICFFIHSNHVILFPNIAGKELCSEIAFLDMCSDSYVIWKWD